MTRAGDAEEFSFHEFWSKEDQAWVGVVDEMPALSWIAEDRTAAAEGIRRLVCRIQTEQPDPEPTEQKEVAPMHEPGGDTAPVELTQLTGSEGGTWHVVTRDSIHVFDLDAGTVMRKPGPTATPGSSGVAQPLRNIVTCIVGERGYWTLHTAGWSDTVDYYWHYSSIVQRIERPPEPTGTPLSLAVE